jgi:hypothetical protein
LWDIEKYESYQYYNEEEFTLSYKNNGLKLFYKELFVSDVDFWCRNIKINKGGFPYEHALMAGKKEDNL